jgi:glycerol-3-phosphate O-acyltransferase
MGMMGVAELLRKAGAFFIRRRFGNDSLYWALITEYVNTAILHGSHPLEMFVEGTRSRSGKSLYPKIGNQFK